MPKHRNGAASYSRCRLFLLFAILLGAGVLLNVSRAHTQEKSDFTSVKIPYYNDDMLMSIIMAKQADVPSLATNSEYVAMTSVTILVYEPFYLPGKKGEVRKPDLSKEPLMKTRVTADTGYFKRLIGRRGIPEQIAHLEGNVKVWSYEYVKDSKGKLLLDAKGLPTRKLIRTVNCEKATWNNASQVLKGKGLVKILERGRIITGHGFTYHVRHPAPHGEDSQHLAAATQNPFSLGSGKKKQRWGGWIILGPPVRMRFVQNPDLKNNLGIPPEATDVTLITSRGEAMYDLDHREVSFEQDVVVLQKQSEIKSDFLRVILDKAKGAESSAPKEILAWGDEANGGGVTIQGRPDVTKNKRGSNFIGRGFYARYLKQKETLILTDGRKTRNGEERVPIVYVNLNRISDRSIEMVFENDELTRLKTHGGKGVAMFMKKASPLEQGKKIHLTDQVSTIIRCDKEMNFYNSKNRAVFAGNVKLEQTGARFAPTDFLKWTRVMRGIFRAGQELKPSAGRRIWLRLPEDVRPLIQKAAEEVALSPTESAHILQSLNDILWDPHFFSARYFTEVIIPDDAKLLLRRRAENLNARQLLLLNRRLFEAAFLGKIRACLDDSDLTLDSDTLTVLLSPPEEKGASSGRQITQLEADGNVVLFQAGRTARASHALLAEKKNQKNAAGENLRYTKLTGLPRPSITKPGEYEVHGRSITIQELAKKNPVTGKSYTRMHVPGPGVVRFLPPSKVPKGEKDTTILLHKDQMEVEYKTLLVYDEELKLAHFRGNVIATADQDKITNSDQLRVWHEESPDPNNPGKTVKHIQRIEALYHATMHWGEREIKADYIIRVLRPSPDGSIKEPYVHIRGNKKHPAKVWIEGGSTFTAPHITVSKEGKQYDATGGAGSMEINDATEGSRALITYEGNARYIVMPNQLGKAEFHRKVVMKRQNMTITGDSLDAYLEAQKRPEDVGNKDDKMPKHKLRRAVVRGGQGLVVITQRQAGKSAARIAWGAEGVLQAHADGDVITLTGTPKRLAAVKDGRGFYLRAPHFRIQESRGLMEAEGPGRVDILSIKQVQGKTNGNTHNEKRDNFIVLFKRQMVYNQLARKIKFYEKVKIRHETLNGDADRMDVLLEDNPDFDTGLVGQDLQVQAIDAEGNTRFYRYPNLTPRMRNIPNLKKEDREGKTFLTRSKKAHYEIESGDIILFGFPPKPGVIEQVITYDSQGRKIIVKRSRVFAKYIKANVITGQVKAPNPDVDPLPKEGPLRFLDE